MRGVRREHPRQWAVTDEQRSRWPGAAPPRRAGAVWLSGVVARSLQTAGGYARRSRLARQPNSRQQNRNLFLNRPLQPISQRSGLRDNRGSLERRLGFTILAGGRPVRFVPQHSFYQFIVRAVIVGTACEQRSTSWKQLFPCRYAAHSLHKFGPSDR